MVEIKIEKNAFRALDQDWMDGVPCVLTRRDREVVDFTRSRVKNNTELTNLGN